MNTRNNIKVFHVVVFPWKEGVLKFLETVSKVALVWDLRLDTLSTRKDPLEAKVFIH